MGQTNLLKNWKEFSEKSEPRTKKKDRDKKRNTFDSLTDLYEGREIILTDYRSGIFPIKKQGEGLKILTSKQMLQSYPIAGPQIKAGNISKNLLNEIRKTIYSLYQAKRNY